MKILLIIYIRHPFWITWRWDVGNPSASHVSYKFPLTAAIGDEGTLISGNIYRCENDFCLLSLCFYDYCEVTPAWISIISLKSTRGVYAAVCQ